MSGRAVGRRGGGKAGGVSLVRRCPAPSPSSPLFHRVCCGLPILSFSLRRLFGKRVFDGFTAATVLLLGGCSVMWFHSSAGAFFTVVLSFPFVDSPFCCNAFSFSSPTCAYLWLRYLPRSRLSFLSLSLSSSHFFLSLLPLPLFLSLSLSHSLPFYLMLCFSVHPSAVRRRSTRNEANSGKQWQTARQHHLKEEDRSG